MITAAAHTPAIRNIEFTNSSILFIYLDNDRTFIVPLDKFPEIQKLSPEQKKNFEIIDDNHLSFIDIDEIYSIHDLIGINHSSPIAAEPRTPYGKKK